MRWAIRGCATTWILRYRRPDYPENSGMSCWSPSTKAEQACVQALCDYLNKGHEAFPICFFFFPGECRSPNASARNRSSAICRTSGSRCAAMHAAKLLFCEPPRTLSAAGAEQAYQCWSAKGNQIAINAELPTRERLARYLGQTTAAGYSPLVARNRYALARQDLALILQQAQAGETPGIHGDAQVSGGKSTVLDELGSVMDASPSLP